MTETPNKEGSSPKRNAPPFFEGVWLRAIDWALPLLVILVALLGRQVFVRSAPARKLRDQKD